MERTPINRMIGAGFLFLLAFAQAHAQTDPSTALGAGPLPSWNDGAAKKAIVEFVKTTTEKGSPQFVAPEARIATFDQDGTTWVEQPMYTQVVYCLERVPAVVKAKPDLANVEPFKTVLSGNREAMAKFTTPQLEMILAATLTGMSVDEFSAEAKKWLEAAKDPRWKRPYTELTYLPMQEVLKYLRANGYRTYIVTGGGQDFVRVYSERVVRHPARAGSRQRRPHQLPLRQRRQAVSDQRPQVVAQRQQCRQARGHPPDDRPPALRGVRQLHRRQADAGVHPGGGRRTARDAAAARRREARVRLRSRTRATQQQGRHVYPGADTTRRKRRAGP